MVKDIWIIGDDAENYGEIETEAPYEILKEAMYLEIPNITKFNLLPLVRKLNKLGWKTRQVSISYLHIPAEFDEGEILGSYFGFYAGVESNEQ